METDLASLILETGLWGSLQPSALPWVTVPPEGDAAPVTVRLARAARLFGKVIGENGEPADWDRAVAKFLLAVMARHSSVSGVGSAKQPSAVAPLLEPHEYSGLNPLPDSCTVQGV